MTYNDPTVQHPWQCERCGAGVRDRELALNADDICWKCVEEEKEKEQDDD